MSLDNEREFLKSIEEDAIGGQIITYQQFDTSTSSVHRISTSSMTVRQAH